MCITRGLRRNFLVEIDFDASVGEYRASFVNARYAVAVRGSTSDAVKRRVVRLVRDYFCETEAAVIFGLTDKAQHRQAEAA